MISNNRKEIILMIRFTILNMFEAATPLELGA